MAMQYLVAPLGVPRLEACQRLQNGLVRRQFHLAAHSVEIEPRIDQCAVEIKNNAANHAVILIQSILPRERAADTLCGPNFRRHPCAHLCRTNAPAYSISPRLPG